jgi:hypothetical protein
MANTVQGHSSQTAYLAIKVETTAGVYITPDVAVPATDTATTATGGATEQDAVLGNRYKNLVVPTTPREPGGSASGPFAVDNALLTAAMSGTTGAQGSYSIEVGVGLTDMVKCAGSLIDTFTVRGQLGSVVTYSAAWKCLTQVPGTNATPPGITAVLGIGCVGIALTGPGLASNGGAGFEITINCNVKTQGKYGQTAPVNIFSGGYGVTAKLTAILSTAAYTVGDTLAAATIALADDAGTPGTTKTFTLANCRVSRAGQTVRVGSITMQDIEVIASAEAGAPLAFA